MRTDKQSSTVLQKVLCIVGFEMHCVAHMNSSFLAGLYFENGYLALMLIL